MAQDKSLTEFFGVGATQTVDSVTFSKSDLKSKRIPIAFNPIIPSASNSAESLFLALLLTAWENQDTSNDAQLAIFGAEVSLVMVPTDGREAPHQQFIFTVRVLNKMDIAMPNPNSI